MTLPSAVKCMWCLNVKNTKISYRKLDTLLKLMIHLLLLNGCRAASVEPGHIGNIEEKLLQKNFLEEH